MTSRALVLQQPSLGEDWRRWGLAAAIVAGAHASLMAGYMLLPEVQSDGSIASPAVILDFAPVPVAPASQQDIAPGPEMVEAQAMPKPPPQKVEPEVVEPTPPMESPAEAEVMLPEPKPKVVEAKPEEQTPDTQQTTMVPPVEQNTPAPQTTAAPKSEEDTAAAPAAPSPGTAATRAAIMSWRDLVMARLQQNKRYPAVSESRREQGIVTLSFTVDRSGKVLTRSIAKSSGHSALDEEVMAMVMRAQPLPAFPAAMNQPSINLMVPIRFSLR